MSPREPRMENDTARRRRRIRVAVVSAASLLALCAMVALAVKMVTDGRGVETHHSVWLVEDSWIGFLVFMSLCVVVVLGGLVWRLVQRRREELAWREHEARWANDQKAAG